MNPNERPSFMDRGTLIALAVVFLFWLGWTKFIESKYGAPTPVKASSPAAASAGAGAAPVATFSVAPGASATVSASNVVSVNATASGEPPKPEQVAHFEDDVWAFDLSSKGMSIRNVNLKKFKSREGDAVVLSESKNGEVSSFGTQLVDRSQDLEFTIEKSTEVGSSTGTGQSHWVGHATTSDGLQIEKSMLIDSSKYTIETSIHIAGVKPGFKGVSVRFGELFHDAVSGGLLNSSRYENQSFFVWHDENSTRLVLRKDKPTDIHESNVAVAGLSGHYFALGFVDRSALAPRFESVLPAQASVADARLI